jgi:hypothetical protein
MHLNDGQLRAHLDGALGASEAQHLAACRECQARLTTLTARAERVGLRLAFLAPQPGDSAPSARAALARFKTRRLEGEMPSMLNQLFSQRLRPAWGLLAVVALIAASLSLAPVRAWAAEFLGLFRVQQITVLPVDTTGLSALAGDETLGEALSKLVADSVTVTKEPGAPRAVADAAEASQAAGFEVRLLGESHGAPEITVRGGAGFEIVVDRARAQAILDQAGRGDLQLPASLEGAVITVDIPTGVSAAYGHCEGLSEPEEEFDPPRWTRVQDCFLLAQVPSPTVSAPPDLDVAQLAEVGLQFTGMTPDEARAFSQTVDWTTTLVVPIPRYGHDYRQVSVDGVSGNLIYRRSDDGVPAHYTLLWVKNGIVYALTGFGGPGEALSLANSLR